ncbi:hypothetical protein EAJ10_07655 [Bacteroides thetaiotaomicron]|uniref:Uncharacterized protein n=1 Tax=Bacteroides thetaiotaomicron TaxID=818 RepID=A0A7J5JPV1_BACT4|nr:hypothetical protein GAN99_07760 [Bacteroides thetaiotaomicron]KAB4453464.1 hypothetical protein GAN93_06920 [Bacteroides thetaiotaomicron]RYT21484.1 hypothetical protein EAJ10_07655 [Bacteroides thetaiotaomicron]
MAASRWNDLPHPTPEYFLLKKSGNPYAVARLFSIFAGLSATRGRTSNCSASCLNLLFRQ